MSRAHHSSCRCPRCERARVKRGVKRLAELRRRQPGLFAQARARFNPAGGVVLPVFDFPGPPIPGSRQ